MLTHLTTDSLVNQTQVDTVPTTSRSEHEPPVAGVQVHTNTKVRSDVTDALLLSTNSTKNPVTIPYVIFNLSLNAHVYLPKGTIVAHPDENEPELDVIKVAETIEEAQGIMQYRNHLPNRPQLPMPPKSNMICSPAKVKYHRRVDHSKITMHLHTQSSDLRAMQPVS